MDRNRQMSKNSNIFILGTTNYKDKMPMQLKDRFSGKTVEIKSQNSIDTKLEIIEFYLNRYPHACDKKCKTELAKKMQNFNVRKIETIINNASIWATKRNDKVITKEDFSEPINDMKKNIEENQKNDSSKPNDGFSIMKAIYATGTVLRAANEAIAISCPACRAADFLKPGSCPELVAISLCRKETIFTKCY